MTEPIAAERIPPDLAPHAVPIETLVPYPGNAKLHDLDVIRQSLRDHGQYRLAVVQESTRHVLVGNGMLEAAVAEGWTELAVTYRDVDDETARRLVLLDNRSTELGGYDDEALAALLQDLPDLSGTGYDDTFLQDLLADLEPFPEPHSDPDEVPPAPSVPVSRPGDVWQLGPHRLVCGDSTDPQVLATVMGGSSADMVWTDPPYGVDYVGGTKAALTIENDGSAGLEELLRAAFTAAAQVCKPGAAWYVAFADKGGSVLPFAVTLGDLGIWRHLIVWVKDSLVLGRGDYHFRHEPIVYGWVPGAARLHPVPDRRQDTVWEIPRPKANKDHPTMKPVALIERALENSSPRGAVVLDPFGGSGSTLIACHLQGRVARIVELDPRYADVICRRFQQVAGVVPVREATGEAVDFDQPAAVAAEAS